MDRVIERSDLTGEQFAVALQRLGDAACVVDRPDDDAGCFLRAVARPTLPLSVRLHTDGMPQVRRGENVREIQLYE